VVDKQEFFIQNDLTLEVIGRTFPNSLNDLLKWPKLLNPLIRDFKKCWLVSLLIVLKHEQIYSHLMNFVNVLLISLKYLQKEERMVTLTLKLLANVFSLKMILDNYRLHSFGHYLAFAFSIENLHSKSRCLSIVLIV
jgi:hypothetical protein